MNTTNYPQFKDYPDVLDIKQVCSLIGICSKTAYKLIRDEKLPSIQVGRQHKVTKQSLLRYLKVSERA